MDLVQNVELDDDEESQDSVTNSVELVHDVESQDSVANSVPVPVANSVTNSVSVTASPRPPAKRLARGKHLIGYNNKWEKDFPWLVPQLEGQIVAGMMCAICTTHYRKNKRNGKAIWAEEPCTSLRRDALLRHQRSENASGGYSLRGRTSGISKQWGY